MKKILGILGLLIFVCVVTALGNKSFLTPYNLQNVVRWTALYGILSIGVAFVIITGGIDLSIGSVVGLIGALLPWLLVHQHWSVPAALALSILVSVTIGLVHGLLITKLNIQPFVVTLSGLLYYRGAARFITGDTTQGFGKSYEGLRSLATGKFLDVPIPFWIMIALAVVAAVFLNRTIWGRYLLALGRNREAARYSGINTDRMTIVAYVICSTMAGIGGILFALDVNSILPSDHGNFFELYAIAAAVLGGCSLRGGEGSIIGVVIGAAVMRVLNNSINLLKIPSALELSIIGLVILGGVIVDELVKRLAAKRRATREARNS